MPGEVAVPPATMTISAARATTGDRLQIALARDLRVRNWRPGDRYQPAHTAEPKKVKELLQARHIPREHKARWPVVIARFSPGARSSVGDTIVWVPGFALPERFRVREPGTEGVRLIQLPLQNHGETGP
jgi:tRNA(Ile)-lysidine synthetase-like protein